MISPGDLRLVFLWKSLWHIARVFSRQNLVRRVSDNSKFDSSSEMKLYSVNNLVKLNSFDLIMLSQIIFPLIKHSTHNKQNSIGIEEMSPSWADILVLLMKSTSLSNREYGFWRLTIIFQNTSTDSNINRPFDTSSDIFRHIQCVSNIIAKLFAVNLIKFLFLSEFRRLEFSGYYVLLRYPE